MAQGIAASGLVIYGLGGAHTHKHMRAHRCTNSRNPAMFYIIIYIAV